jgi:hypothetical protein
MHWSKGCWRWRVKDDKLCCVPWYESKIRGNISISGKEKILVSMMIG